HTIVPPVPSLFTFNIQDERIGDLPGITADVHLRILDGDERSIVESSGPLLITHWGMSGPAILRLSAWGARLLQKANYRFVLEVNWLGDEPWEQVIDQLKARKQ